MTITKILFLVGSPFNQRDLKRFGIELFIENGFEVEVWDLAGALRPRLAHNYTPPDTIVWEGCASIDNVKTAHSMLADIPAQTFVINLMGYNPDFYGAYKSLSSSNAKYAVFMANAVPTVKVGERRNLLSRYFAGLRQAIKRGTLRKAVKAVSIHRTPTTMLGMKPARLILAGGERCLTRPCPKNHSTEIVWAHNLDYDLFLQESANQLTERPIAVFLDDVLPFNSDFIRSGIRPPVEVEEYYPQLNKFFNVVEKKLGLQTVIAAHPRSHYDEWPDYFEGRECIRGKTIELVRQSQLVMAHGSYALNFANLFHKPAIFITWPSLDNSFHGQWIRLMANWFGKTPISTENTSNINWKEELKVSSSNYNQYRTAYIKKDSSPNIPFWQIIADRIRLGV